MDISEVERLFIENKMIILVILSIFLFLVVTFTIRYLIRNRDENKIAHRLHSDYLNSSLSGSEIGLQYERYLGFLHEQKGEDVEYNGALCGFQDLGRDLITKKGNFIKIIQAKCWAGFKTINENHIFQLYGTAKHFQKLHQNKNDIITPVFYTSAVYSETAKEVAETLGVELKNEKLDRSYPMIKCIFNSEGLGLYFLPVDPSYDEVRVDNSIGGTYVFDVLEAVGKGFLWSQSKSLK